MKGLKLNKTQISVLASEIYSELELEANKYKQTEEYINFEKTIKEDDKYLSWRKLIKALDVAVKDGIIVENDYEVRELKSDFRKYVSNLRDKSFEKQGYYPTKTSIENKIILNTIDVDNLEELINKVKESFKK